MGKGGEWELMLLQSVNSLRLNSIQWSFILSKNGLQVSSCIDNKSQITCYILHAFALRTDSHMACLKAPSGPIWMLAHTANNEANDAPCIPGQFQLWKLLSSLCYGPNLAAMALVHGVATGDAQLTVPMADTCKM